MVFSADSRASGAAVPDTVTLRLGRSMVISPAPGRADSAVSTDALQWPQDMSGTESRGMAGLLLGALKACTRSGARAMLIRLLCRGWAFGRRPGRTEKD